MLACFVSACQTRIRVARPEGSPPGVGPQDIALKVNDTVRATLRDGSHLNGLVSAIELDALTLRGLRADGGARQADHQRILWSAIVQLEHVETSAARTILLVLGIVVMLPVTAMILFTLSPNGGR
jgi:hypothetical protein